MIERVCIIGGGNLGMALAVEIYRNTGAEIVLLTSKSKIFSKTITGIDMETNISTSGELFLVTDNYSEALVDVDIVFITIPAFLIKDVAKNIKLTKRTVIILVPGSGGREFYFQNFADEGHLVVGLDRVPLIARISEPGKTVMLSKKNKIRFATLRGTDDSFAGELLSFCLDIQCIAISNFLNVTFTPSNQILHTTRLFAMLAERKISDPFYRQIKFYAEWDDASSNCLLSADNELQNICKSYDLSEVIPLQIHYESESACKLTEKMRSIKSLSNIEAPFIQKGGKYFVDTQSRYFQEDFPYGLCIIKDFATIAEINTPVIDGILNWFTVFFNLEYFVDESFTGKDLQNLSIPRNFGMTTVRNVCDFYRII